MRVLFLALCCSAALLGESVFPPLVLYTLRSEKKVLPNGKKGLVFMGWQGEARDTLTQWYNALRSRRVLAGSLALTVVPIFPPYMSHAVSRVPLMAVLRKVIPERFAGNIGVLFSTVEETASLFRQTKEDFLDLRTFLIDEKGSILWQAKGAPTAQTLQQLDSALAT